MSVYHTTTTSVATPAGSMVMDQSIEIPAFVETVMWYSKINLFSSVHGILADLLNSGSGGSTVRIWDLSDNMINPNQLVL